MTRIAIVILNWNGWQDTLACLKALQALNDVQFEIIVVDNASSNDSVARITGAFPDVTLIENASNLGFAGGNNVGIALALARGVDYVWLLNADTIPEPDSLSALVRTARAKKAHLVGSVLMYADQPDTVQAWGGGRVSFWLGRSRHCRDARDARKLDYLVAASLLVHVDVFRACGLLDSGFFVYWEDTDFCFAARQAGFELAVAHDSIVLHRESASLGKRNPKLDFFFSSSSVRFFNRYSRWPAWPIWIGALSRVARRLIQRDWPRVRAVLAPLLDKNARWN